jgi:hypothetical protein
MNNPPKLESGQVSLMQCDINTGIVLKTDGKFFTQTGEIFQIFDSLEVAEQVIDTSFAKTPDTEFIVYNHNGDCVLSWNRLEKKRIS